MSQSFFDRLFSVGVMFFGVFLMALGSASVSLRHLEPYQLPFTEIVTTSTPAIPPLPPVPPPPQLVGAAFNHPLSAAAALIVDENSGAVLFQRQSTTTRPLASITKLMTALVLRDLPLEWNTSTVVAKADVDSSSHQLRVGDKLSLSDLWNVALVGSSNSAISALVRSCGVSSTEFIEAMNKKALALGMTSAHFTDPTGLDAGNCASAEDIITLLRAALRTDVIRKTLQEQSYVIRPGASKETRRVWSTNWLLTKWVPSKFGQDFVVGKTGYIADSLYNFAARFTRPDSSQAVYVVVLGADSNESRFTEARDLAEWAFSAYQWDKTPSSSLETVR